MAITDPHLLRTLQLPSRYEPLVRLVGPEVLNLLVPPAPTTLEVLEEAGEAVRSLGEGLFLPIFANPGTGKTTLAENLTVFMPDMYSKTVTYNGALVSRDMEEALSLFIRDELQQNDMRVIPMNVDHREDRPPSREEMSEVKRFLRAGLGQRVLLTWPGTMRDTAEKMAADYRNISGVVPLKLPIDVEGPAPDRWTPLAAQTLQLANQVDSLEDIVDLDQYSPEAFPSLGDYLKQIAIDFNRQKLALQRATKKPLELSILVVSETSGHGVLSTLTSSRRFGMLDPSALLQASGESAIGKWWAEHRGLLVQTIVTLDAHVFSVSPPLSLATFRRYGPADVIQSLDDLGFGTRTPGEVSTYLGRSDLGRHLAKEQRAVGETRGNPAEDARMIFETFVDHGGGFQGGRDKKLNIAFRDALVYHLTTKGISDFSVRAEESLEFLPSLIPDVSIETHESAHCLEFTYRKGDFVTSENRGTIARYCLEKLRNYARQLGWISAGA
ncbi:hypothetical protein [Cellulomonas triticagri]|uniref:Uncharacterized protein n=1 Tax=Cellulomonas triticagri TaxID=2483352 RepID=A0A3M2JAS0_9CELL|nr:hypothetical protein [Cellulomonas triticagri]RMI09286.1 hypothetical protein EBM89_11005 [Cellulomonas triticagri]